MSELTVGSLSGLASNDFVIDVAPGSKIVQPGAVLQVVSTTKTNRFTMSSATFATVTDLSLSITPRSTSSKIWVVADMNVANTNNDLNKLRLRRDSTEIFSATGGVVANGIYSANLTVTSVNYNTPVSFNVLDSPNTSSSVTYDIQVASGGTQISVNASDNNNYSAISTITLMEIAG